MKSEINRKLFVTAASAVLIAGCSVPFNNVIIQNSTAYAASEENTFSKITKLEKDMTLEGDAVIDADIDLNGHTLTVKGNLLHTSGKISFGNGEMIITGNYLMQKAETDSSGKTEYFNCTAHLMMTDPYDKLTVEKNFEAHSLYYKSELSNGEIIFNGDVTVDGTLNLSDDTVISFNGTEVQKINAKKTTFAKVRQSESSGHVLTFTDEMNIIKPKSDINAVSDNAVIYELDLSGKTLAIDGDVKIGWEKDAKVDLTSGTLSVKGNVEHKNGKVTLNNGSFNISGSYLMQNKDNEKDEYSNCFAVLCMDNPYDKLTIDGDFEVHSLYYSSDFSNGELAVSGNITSDRTIKLYEGTIINLCGKDKQTISADYTTFANLKVTGDPDHEIHFDKDIRIQSLKSDMHAVSDNAVIYELDLTSRTLTIDGDVTIGKDKTAKIDLSSGTLNINGNVEHKEGNLKAGNGTMNVSGNYVMQNVESGKTEYQNCYATISMTDPYDKINIGGNFEVHKLYYSNAFENGVLSIAGNIYADGTAKLNGETKIVLNGTKTQTVTLKGETLGVLEVKDPDKHKIKFTDDIRIGKFAGDIYAVSDNASIYSLNLNSKTMTIEGDIGIGLEKDASVDLSSGTLNIIGNVEHRNGKVAFTNGEMKVWGNYVLKNEDKTENCYATMTMKDPYDKFSVSGNLEAYKPYYNSEFSNGVMTIGGDIIWDGRLVCEGSHKTVLAGKDKQKVKMNTGSTFQNLVLTKDRSNYTFEPDECWKSLKSDEIDDPFKDKPVIETTDDPTDDPKSDPTSDPKDDPTDKPGKDVPIVEPDPITDILYGDINNDGIVDLTDLSKFAILLVDKCEFTSLQTKVADFDKDGVAGLTDLARLRQYISKVIEVLVD